MLDRNPFSERYRDNDEDIMFSILSGKYSRREEDENKNGYEVDDEDEEIEEVEEEDLEEEDNEDEDNNHW